MQDKKVGMACKVFLLFFFAALRLYDSLHHVAQEVRKEHQEMRKERMGNIPE